MLAFALEVASFFHAEKLLFEKYFGLPFLSCFGDFFLFALHYHYHLTSFKLPSNIKVFKYISYFIKVFINIKVFISVATLS